MRRFPSYNVFLNHEIAGTENGSLFLCSNSKIRALSFNCRLVRTIYSYRLYSYISQKVNRLSSNCTYKDKYSLFLSSQVWDSNITEWVENGSHFYLLYPQGMLFHVLINIADSTGSRKKLITQPADYTLCILIYAHKLLYRMLHHSVI